MRAWLQTLSVSKKLGGALTLTGAALTVALAFLGNVSEPPSAAWQAFIAFLAIVAQIGAAIMFGKEGRTDPAFAQRSVSRLVGLAKRASEARETAELLAERGAPVGEVREAIGVLSVHLSYFEEGYLDAIDDWRTFHPDAVQAAESLRSVDDE